MPISFQIRLSKQLKSVLWIRIHQSVYNTTRWMISPPQGTPVWWKSLPEDAGRHLEFPLGCGACLTPPFWRPQWPLWPPSWCLCTPHQHPAGSSFLLTWVSPGLTKASIQSSQSLSPPFFPLVKQLFINGLLLIYLLMVSSYLDCHLSTFLYYRF